jgi:hypothetical protein
MDKISFRNEALAGIKMESLDLPRKCIISNKSGAKIMD